MDSLIDNLVCTLLGLLFTSGTTYAQPDNYLPYHQSIAAAENLLMQEQFAAAEQRLDSLFATHEPTFARDGLLAAQLSLLNGHIDKGLNYLKIAMERGVTYHCLTTIPLFKKTLTITHWQILKAAAPQCREVYFSRIDVALQIEFQQRYQKEQANKSSSHYSAIVYNNFNRIKNLTATHGFPGEHLIGIDNPALAPNSPTCTCGNRYVIPTLLHYDYPIGEIPLDTLISEIKKGHLHPRALCTIYAFQQSKVSSLYDQSSKKPAVHMPYHFNFPFEAVHPDIEQVNADRHSFGICSYETDKRRSAISRQYGLWLFAGY